MAPELQDVGLAVKRVQHRHHRALDARLSAELGISLVQWDALRHIDRNPGSSLHGLAELTFQTDQSFGALAARLVRRGLVERVPGSGRALRHRLTPAGTELLRKGGAIVDGVLAESFQPLSATEVATLHVLLTRLLAR
ncbi:MAG: MarR family winged helix-turn-helix transcriptional regulator [Mycobacteriales bacterium]